MARRNQTAASSVLVLVKWLLAALLAAVPACSSGRGGPVRFEEAALCSPPTLQVLLLSGG